VERVNKNHLVNNFVEAYLKSNPGELFNKPVTLHYVVLKMIGKAFVLFEINCSPTAFYIVSFLHVTF